MCRSKGLNRTRTAMLAPRAHTHVPLHTVIRSLTVCECTRRLSNTATVTAVSSRSALCYDIEPLDARAV